MRALASRPELDERTEFVWNGFLQLRRRMADSDRIPYPTICAWLDENLVQDPQRRLNTIDLIDVLDWTLHKQRNADAASST